MYGVLILFSFFPREFPVISYRLAQIIALPAIAHSVVAWETNRPRHRQRHPRSTTTYCCRSNWRQLTSITIISCKSGTTFYTKTAVVGAALGLAVKVAKVGPSGRSVPGVMAPGALEVEAAGEEEEDWESVVAAVVQRMESTISRT